MEINLLAGTFVESIFYWHGNYKYLLKYAEAVDAPLRPFFFWEVPGIGESRLVECGWEKSRSERLRKENLLKCTQMMGRALCSATGSGLPAAGYVHMRRNLFSSARCILLIAAWMGIG